MGSIVCVAAAAAVKTRDLSAFGCSPLVGVVAIVVAVVVQKGYPPGSSILSLVVRRLRYY